MFVNTGLKTVTSLYAMCPLYIWVGFMGGACYVNVMHQILEHSELKKTEKDVALVLNLIFVDIGCLLAAIFTLVLDLTLFQS